MKKKQKSSEDRRDEFSGVAENCQGSASRMGLEVIPTSQERVNENVLESEFCASL